MVAAATGAVREDPKTLDAFLFDSVCDFAGFADWCASTDDSIKVVVLLLAVRPPFLTLAPALALALPAATALFAAAETLPPNCELALDAMGCGMALLVPGTGVGGDGVGEGDKTGMRLSPINSGEMPALVHCHARVPMYTKRA